MPIEHISDHDLERYYLGMVTDEAELAPLEEPVMVCLVRGTGGAGAGLRGCDAGGDAGRALSSGPCHRLPNTSSGGLISDPRRASLWLE